MNIVLGVSGGIAAYKTPELVRRLRDAGWDVRVIMTPNAERFVTPLSLAAVSESGVISHQWGDSSSGGVDHIEIARWADAMLIAPATANVIAKLAAGIADDALTTYALAHRTRLVVAPAMNTTMLGHPSVRHNLTILRDRGVEIVEPDAGLLACGDEGAGRLPDPDVLIASLAGISNLRDLEGKRVLVTAGPTREPIDPVRYLTNRSSGKMGYAVASRAASRGADVIIVSGPTDVEPPRDVRVERVMTASEMYVAVESLLDGVDVFIGAAAVADYTSRTPSEAKVKKNGSAMNLELVETRDILAMVGSASPRPFVVGFAAETNDLVLNARNKLVSKNVDLIVANDVSRRDVGFDRDYNEVVVVEKGGEIALDRGPKTKIADRILDLVVERISPREESDE